MSAHKVKRIVITASRKITCILRFYRAIINKKICVIMCNSTTISVTLSCHDKFHTDKYKLCQSTV